MILAIKQLLLKLLDPVALLLFMCQSVVVVNIGTMVVLVIEL